MLIRSYDSYCHLREFVFANERHPESMRTVPWLRPAGRDSAPPESAESAENPKSRSLLMHLDHSTSLKIALKSFLFLRFRSNNVPKLVCTLKGNAQKLAEAVAE